MSKYTRQQAATRKMNLLKMDMLSIIEETPERFFPTYDPITPIKIALHDTIIKIRQYAHQSHRIAALVYLYYLGELLSVTTNPHQIWINYLRENSLPNYQQYYHAANQIFQIFNGNIEQIYQTKFLSMYYIAGMTNSDYQNNLLPLKMGP